MKLKLIILRGNSGCGKSSTAKELQKALGPNTMCISQDLIRREILKVKDKEGNPSINLIKEIALYGKSQGFNVIIEGILTKSKYGGMLLNLSKEFNQTFIYYFDVSFEETLSRHKTKPNADDFGEIEMRRWWKDKDFLIEGEDRIIVENSSLSETIKMILSDIEMTSSELRS